MTENAEGEIFGFERTAETIRQGCVEELIMLQESFTGLVLGENKYVFTGRRYVACSHSGRNRCVFPIQRDLTRSLEKIEKGKSEKALI